MNVNKMNQNLASTDIKVSEAEA